MSRDTPYAKELKTAAISGPGGHESRIERLFVKDKEQEEIRFSWWVSGMMQNRPLDLPEDELARLIAKGIVEGVLSPLFLVNVQEAMAGR